MYIYERGSERNGKDRYAVTNEELYEIKRKYGWEVFKNEVVKMIILTALFFAMGQLDLFLFAAAVLITIRTFSGGLHMTGNVSCFVFSLCFFLIAIELFPMIPVNPALFSVLTMFSFGCIIIFSPADSPQKPILSERIRKKYRLRAALLTAAVIVILCVLFYLGIHRFCSVGVGILVLQAVQLLLSRLSPKRKEKQYEE